LKIRRRLKETAYKGEARKRIAFGRAKPIANLPYMGRGVRGQVDGIAFGRARRIENPPKAASLPRMGWRASCRDVGVSGRGGWADAAD
jgi:hypothetical protein